MIKTLKRLRIRRPGPGLRPRPLPLPGPKQRQPAVPAPQPIVDLPGAYMPPDWQLIDGLYMSNDPKPFVAPCNILTPEWQWRAVFNEAGDKVILHSPCWVDMGGYMDYDVKPSSVMSSTEEMYTNVIKLADGRRYRVRRENPPGWAGLSF